jgi:hypothetical protein
VVPTLDCRDDLKSLDYALLYTLVRLRLDPRLQLFVPTFEELRGEWEVVAKKERALIEARAEAEAKVHYADAGLDHTCDGIAAATLVETKNNRKAALYTRYFGSQKPSRFRRSVLGPQLAAMRTWPPSLKESQIPALVSYGEALTAQVAAADDAVTRLSVADQETTDFRTFGARKQLFDKVNGARKQLHGDVSKMIHEHPEWNLTRDYVEALFEHRTRTKAAPPSDAELEEKIKAAHSEAARLTAVREERIKRAEAEVAERAEAEKKAKLLAIAAAEKAAAEANAKLLALKADLDPGA